MQKYYPSGHIFLIHFPDGTGTVLYPFCGMCGGPVVRYAVYLFLSHNRTHGGYHGAVT